PSSIQRTGQSLSIHSSPTEITVLLVCSRSSTALHSRSCQSSPAHPRSMLPHHPFFNLCTHSDNSSKERRRNLCLSFLVSFFLLSHGWDSRSCLVGHRLLSCPARRVRVLCVD